MKKLYTRKSVITINALDATYTVAFDEEFLYGRAWEFNPMSDAIQNETKHTDIIRVTVAPDKRTMAFAEDADRRMVYYLPIENAREAWKALKEQPQLWFFLDFCALYENEVEPQYADAMSRALHGERIVAYSA